MNINIKYIEQKFFPLESQGWCALTGGVTILLPTLSLCP